jgi:propanediol dehydratase large subunit
MTDHGDITAAAGKAGRSGTGERKARSTRPIGRFRTLNARRVNLDGFATENPELGLVALESPYDRPASLKLSPDGEVVELDGRAEADFDIIDTYLARHGIDLTVAEEAMALTDLEAARLILDWDTPRDRIARLVAGMTPAKLARVVALLRPAELMPAVTKMRVRRTPSIQAHVTNRLDDPLLLAADAATAVAFGFRELENTVPVLAHAPSTAVAVLIGSQVAAPGALTQCSIEEALELELGLRGLTTYAETVSLYGTEQVFIDGDDTPWSKAFLCSAYASRGLKMRVTSGGGAEALMGAAEQQSLLALESRCVSLARAIGAQGVQNGGIDGVNVVASVPYGMREVLAENLMVMLRDLESCSGNDTLMSESDMRRTAHTVPLLLAGSDFIFSGFGSIPRYDNMFGPSNFNAEDLDDYLVLQRDWGVDGALRPVDEETVKEVRERAARAVQAVYRDLGLYDYDDARVHRVVRASGSKDLPDIDPLAPCEAAAAIRDGGLGVLDVVASLARTGFGQEAERVLAMARERIKGDYLQTAAIFDEGMNVLSKITDPNDYTGPGAGYDLTEERAAEIAAIRQQRSIADLLADQARFAGHVDLPERVAAAPRSDRQPRSPMHGRPAAPSAGQDDRQPESPDVTGRSAAADDRPPVSTAAPPGTDPREVCVGISPAFARSLWLTLSGLPVGEVLRQVFAGFEEEGCIGRLIRVRSTIDLGMIGLTAARLAGSGIGVGLQAKGTALIHRRDLTPLANLELYSIAPLVTAQMYRQLGQNAARHAKGMTPIPVQNPYTDEAIGSRYHSRAVAMTAVEREACEPLPPVDLEFTI